MAIMTREEAIEYARSKRTVNKPKLTIRLFKEADNLDEGFAQLKILICRGVEYKPQKR